MGVRRVFVVWIMALAAMTPSAKANDSSVALDNNELIFLDTDAIRLLEEELYISRGKIEVHYVFENLIDQDVNMMIGFPIDTGFTGDDGDKGLASPMDANGEVSTEFVTLVNGQPIKALRKRIAYDHFEDITGQLSDIGIALDQPSMEWTEEQKEQLTAMGLYADDQAFFNIYDVYLWEMLFPASQKVEVKHAYAPSVGNGWWSLSDDYALWSYCMDESFQKGAENHLQGGMMRAETLNYVFGTGGHWADTIGEIEVTIDKGDPSSLVSFCADGVEKISDTEFRFTLEDYEPVPDDIFKVFFVD